MSGAVGMRFFFSPDIYTVMLFLYACSVGLFFVDFLKDNRIANRMGVGLMGVVWILETVFMGTRFYADHVLPFYSSGQATIFFSWLLITVSVAVSYFSRIDYFAFFVNLLGFLFVAFDTFFHGESLDVIPKPGDLLLLHISFAFLSYIAFTLSCIFSILYLLVESALRMKRFSSGSFRRLPALQALDVYAYRAALVGGPMLLIAMILGAVWYVVLTGKLLLLDAKTIVSILLFAVYACYLYFRASGRISGRRAAWWNISAFIGVIINFLVISEFMSKYHR